MIFINSKFHTILSLRKISHRLITVELAIFLLIATPVPIMAQQQIPLYRGSIPYSKPFAIPETEDTTRGILLIHHVTIPTLTYYLPEKDKATGVGVLICPGGGYSILAAGHEGYDVAKRFTEMGVAAFVLKYRLPNDQVMKEKHLVPLHDAQRALAIIRKNARKWNVDRNRIGIMGFSAGGHLAATAGTNPSVITGKPVKKSHRPDFMVLIYPVISFTDSIGHIGSRNQLLGKNPSSQQIQLFSNELQVTSQTAPAFLVHALDDYGVSYKNSIHYLDALRQKQIPSELFLYEKGGHGFGMNNPTSPVQWMDKVYEWMVVNKWIR